MPQTPPIITLNTDFANGEASHNSHEPELKPKDLNKDYAAEASEIVTDASAEDAKRAKDDEDARFPLGPSVLNALIDPKNPYVLQNLGGVEGLAASLHTNLEQGLTDGGEDVAAARTKVYGKNKLPDRNTKSIFLLMWMALQDKVLIILVVAAIISLALGLYETFGQPPEYDELGRAMPRVDWVEGVAIIIAIIVVVVVGSANDYQKERQFMKLNKKKDERVVNVIRNGQPVGISIFALNVGDLVMTEPGDMLAADGVLVSGHALKCDESSATGESDALKKVPADQVLKLLGEMSSKDQMDPADKHLDCFLISGAKVLEGTGVYLVTAVGPNSQHGRIMMSLNTDPEATPLQEKLNGIADGIAVAGIGAALILFLVLFIKFLAGLKTSELTSGQKGEQFMKLFIVAVTIVVVAVPEGLPLAVTLALAFATTRMLKDNNLVRVLKACETMGGATTICSDKTGTLTQNKMTVTKGTWGSKSFEVSDKEGASDFEGSDKLRKLLEYSIAINSSAFANTGDDKDTEPFVGSKTETALLGYMYNVMKTTFDLEEFRKKFPTSEVFPFDSAKKFMACTVNVPEFGKITLVKGASEVVLKSCSTIWDDSNQTARELTKEDRQHFVETINNYASASLRTIGLSVIFDSKVDGKSPISLPSTFLGVVGIKDPLRPGVPNAVAQCAGAGVVVRMVTGDNINTARAIALDCGILSSDDDVVMEGPAFRKLSGFELNDIAPRLRVLARSSPDDKKKLVNTLKALGETVAVTGDGTNDAMALKAADVGFSMGIAGTEVAKEASDIILMDDNFTSIVKAILWGRNVNDAVKKFLQFQLTVNITAVLLTFVSAVASSDNASVLTAVQLLWVNLIMDTMAALALATDPPSPSSLKRPPDGRGVGLITVTMWKMILGQALFQLIVTFVLHFASGRIWNLQSGDAARQQELNAMVFNAFVWLQLFNMFVNRRLDNGMNFMEGVFKNWYFIGIVLIIAGVQVMIMFVGGAAFSVTRNTGPQWAVAIICGLVSLPAGCILRMIPDEWCLKIWPSRVVNFILRILFFWKKKPRAEIFINDEEAQKDFHWNPALEEARDQLKFIKRVRGGRLNQLRFGPAIKKVIEVFTPSSPSTPASLSGSASSNTAVGDQSPNTFRHTEGGFLGVPSPIARRQQSANSISSLGSAIMVPALVGGALGGGWQVAEDDSKSPTTPK